MPIRNFARRWKTVEMPNTLSIFSNVLLALILKTNKKATLVLKNNKQGTKRITIIKLGNN
jgi:hypothetical protein